MAAGTVTLANGRVVTVTRDNYQDLARENLAAYQAKGIDVDQASILQAFLQLAGQDTAFYTYGPGGAVPVNDPARRVLDNPFVKWSDAIMEATPTGLRTVWQGASDGTFGAGRSVVDGVKRGATAAADLARRLAGALPGALKQANTTLRIVWISAAVIVVAGGGAYALHKLKR